ncbi:MAG: hypothetical protein IH605_04595 [Burkholderiales bacterium]|nr:hypothetical protein [Burkholderiales bacterium]
MDTTKTKAERREEIDIAISELNDLDAFPSVATTNTSADDNSDLVKCPGCGDTLERIGRTIVMRALIGSKRYYCGNCRQNYLDFLGRLY